jgi:hypothetical protein
MTNEMAKPEDNDQEVERLLAIWERADRFFWKKVGEVILSLAMGIAIADILTILIIWMSVFIQMR